MPNGDALTLADCPLAPMIDYFQRAEQGTALLADAPALSRWWRSMLAWELFCATDPLADSGVAS